MIILLVIATFLIAFFIDMIVRKVKKPSIETKSAEVTPVAPGEHTSRFFHPGHGWALPHSANSVIIGVDDFAQAFIGRIDTIDLPAPDAVVHQGGELATFHHGKKSLTITSPISGVLTEVNESLVRHPEIVNGAPYTKGWIAKILPFNYATELCNLMKDTTAVAWQEAVRSRVIHCFAPAIGPVFQDGGDLIDNISDLVPDREWTRFSEEFFPHPLSSEQKHSHQ